MKKKKLCKKTQVINLWRTINTVQMKSANDKAIGPYTVLPEDVNRRRYARIAVFNQHCVLTKHWCWQEVTICPKQRVRQLDDWMIISDFGHLALKRKHVFVIKQKTIELLVSLKVDEYD